MGCGFCFEFEFAKSNFDKDKRKDNMVQDFAVKLDERWYRDGVRVTRIDGCLHELNYCPECGKKLENV